MKTIKTEVYEFKELDDYAKAIARDWYREHALDYEWWDSTYEDAKTVGLKITSFDLDRSRHAKGTLTLDAEEVAQAIIKEHGNKTDTHTLAREFLVDIKKTRGDGEYSDACEDFTKALLEEYSVMLQKESEYLVSDEVVDESITANEYTFTKEGKRFG